MGPFSVAYDIAQRLRNDIRAYRLDESLQLQPNFDRMFNYLLYAVPGKLLMISVLYQIPGNDDFNRKASSLATSGHDHCARSWTTVCTSRFCLTCPFLPLQLTYYTRRRILYRLRWQGMSTT